MNPAKRQVTPGDARDSAQENEEAPTYSWQRLRPAFLRALTGGRAAEFCEMWLEQLEAPEEDLTSEERRHETTHPDLPWLNETRDSLSLLLRWWLPSRTTDGAPNAARQLRQSVVISLKLHAIIVSGIAIQAKEDERDTRTLNLLVRRIRQLEADEVFLAGVAIRLAAYDPSSSAMSPDAALSGAVEAEMKRHLGWLLDSTRAEVATRRPTLTRKSLGNEIRRRLALPQRDSARIDLETALGKLPESERTLLTTIYGEGGYKAAQRGGLSGREIDELRGRGLPALVELVPELRRFLLP